MPLPPEASDPLTLLLELGQAFHSTLQLDPLLSSILRQMQSAVHSEGASIWLLDKEHRSLKCTHAVGPEIDQVIGVQLPAHEFKESTLALKGQSLKIDDLAEAIVVTGFIQPFVRPHVRNLVVAPLLARGELLGMIHAINKLDAPSFSEDDHKLLAALAGHAGVAIQNAQLYEQQRRNSERQRLLDQISRHFQQTLDIDELIPLVLEEVNKAIGAEGQSLWLLSPNGQEIGCRFATGPGAENIKKVVVPMGKGILGTSVAKQESIIITDAQNDARFFRAADNQTGFVTRSVLCVPMVRKGRAFGAIEAVNKKDGDLFVMDDLDLLRSITDSAALAVENARLFAELAASYDNTLDALAAALDLRDRETEGHSRRVVEYTARLAHQIGLDEALISEIRRGALIHDIGKIGVPDAILHKPGPLDSDERRVIERHPQAGYEMLLGIPYLKEEIRIVLTHQEKWDGTGYPLGLRGEEIPLGARLFAIADTYDALTSDRPYRKGRSYEVARQIIAEEAGKQFDPQAVAAFLAVPVEEWQQIRSKVSSEIAHRRAEHEERVRHGTTGRLQPINN